MVAVMSEGIYWAGKIAAFYEFRKCESTIEKADIRWCGKCVYDRSHFWWRIEECDKIDSCMPKGYVQTISIFMFGLG